MNNTATKIAPLGDWRQETGPLKALLMDGEVSEIMVNSWNDIFIERNGFIETSEAKFANAQQFMQCIQALCVFAGREVNRRTPFIDARLPDGSRMNVVVPPVSHAPVLTIRKAIDSVLNYETMIKSGSLTEKAIYFLNKIVDGRQNIIITGGSGRGKTAMLSVLSSLIDSPQRVIVIEDTSELKVQVKNFVRMELPHAVPGEVQLKMADLLRNALRMRPDRIIVGECRGNETIDMLLAMNTGHEGSMTTVHANSAIDGLARLESLVLNSETNLPRALIQQNIASTVHYVIHMDRDPNGKRRLDEVLEIRGWEDGNYLTAPIFKWTAEAGLLTTGKIPRIAKERPAPGIKFHENFFDPSQNIRLK
jgi:pilus assembly protein CpaF